MTIQTFKSNSSSSLKKFIKTAATIEKIRDKNLKNSKVNERHQKLQVIIKKKYDNYVKQLDDCYSMTSRLTDFANCSFSAYGKSLYYITSGLSIEIKNFSHFQELFFPRYKASHEEAAIEKQKRLYHALCSYCTFRVSIKKDYPTYVHLYKLIHSNPNAYCFLDQPFVYFFMHNNNLCFNPYGTHLSNVDHYNCIIVSDNVTESIFRFFNLPNPKKHLRDMIFKKLYQLLRSGYKASPINHRPNTLLYRSNTSFLIHYDPFEKLFNKINNTTFDINIPKTIAIQDPNFNEDYYPENFLEFLYWIGKGDLNVVDKLAQLIASCYLSLNSTQKLTIIIGNKDSIAVIWNFFEIILDNNFSFYSLKELCNHREIKGLAEHCLKGTYANISYLKNHSSLPARENYEILNKIIKSKALMIKDSIQGEITYINSMHLICLSENESLALQLSNIYPSTIIKLMPFHSESNAENKKFDYNYPIDFKELSWIRTPFALHGLRGVLDKRAVTEKKDHQDSILEFINSCCIESNDVESYAVDLYEKYSIYSNKSHGYVPFTQILFNKELKKSGKYKFYRPHRSRSEPNRFAFIGLSVDKFRFENAVRNNGSIVEKIKDDIKNHLISINHDYIHRKRVL